MELAKCHRHVCRWRRMFDRLPDCGMEICKVANDAALCVPKCLGRCHAGSDVFAGDGILLIPLLFAAVLSGQYDYLRLS